eukprot:g11362.t1
MPSPPTRRSHDKHVQIMTTFVKAVDRSPQRFAKMIHRQREAAGMHDSDNEIEVSVSEEKKGQKRKAMDFFTTDGSRTDGHSPRRVCLWCFSCSVTMKELLKHEVHSVIITSGTLSPISSTAEAFGVPFPVVLENRHVINPRKQVFGAVLSEGPTQGSLDASFQHRNEMAYIKDRHVDDPLSRGFSYHLLFKVPDGVLLAFSSYGMKDSILESWRQLGLLEEIAREKPVFEEPKGSNETKQIMEQYNAALKGSGAILAAVCRGKLCEGIDFTDKQCRMVVMVGIPYPAKNDLRLQSAGNGQRWYQREAMRAVNQTLGRVIRHRPSMTRRIHDGPASTRSGRSLTQEEKEAEKARLQTLVNNFAKKAVRGCPCVYFKEGTAQRFVTQYRIDLFSAFVRIYTAK